MGDTIKARKGLKANIDHLLLGEFGFTTDEERVYIGGNNGNIPLPNAADLSDVAHKTGTMQTNLNADMVDGIQGSQIPLKTTANLTYYVNTSTGLDTNDGLTSETALKTIMSAVNKLPQTINHNIIINVAAGTYNETVTFYGFNGKGFIALIGGSNTTDAVNYVVKAISISLCSCKINVTAITANTTTEHAFLNYSSIYVEFLRCVCTVTSSTFCGLITSNGGASYVGGCILSNRSIGVISQFGSTIISDNNTGTGNTAGISAIYGGTIAKADSQPTGTTSEQVATGGVIR